ncbi:hypothetical protein SARC_17433, partial [Sphaeroforma arctica JP610]
IDMENMFELLENSPTIQDKDNAVALRAENAPEVRFSNVSFAYGDRMILKDISFTIPKGQVCACVRR